MDGKPLPNATVVFTNENGRPAAATTDSDGQYVLHFTEGRLGAIPGKNSVRITTLRDAAQTEDGTTIPGSPETIPMEYNAMSKLEFVVEPGKKNIANFDISSKGAIAVPDE